MSKVKISRRLEYPDGGGPYRLLAWTAETTDALPPEIFLFRRYPEAPSETPEPSEEFVRVARYSDLFAAPAGAPSGENPFFRRAHVALELESMRAVATTLNDIRTGVAELLSDIGACNGEGATTSEEI